MITLEWDEGTTAWWSELTDEQLDKVARYIERNFKICDGHN